MHPLFQEEHSLKNIRYVSHRGFTPLAPENSLPSFAYAGQLRQWATETDVHMTRDGILVCNHDYTIDRMYNGTGNIADMTLKEINGFRINSGNRLECFEDDALRMPLFSEYLAICRRYGSIPFIELKTEDAEPVVWQLHKEGFSDGEVVMSSCNFQALKNTYDIAPDMFIHWIFAKDEHIEELASFKYAGLSLNETDLTKEWLPDRIRQIKAMGLKICLRAGDSVESVRKMMDMGLDYIPSNCMHLPNYR